MEEDLKRVASEMHPGAVFGPGFLTTKRTVLHLNRIDYFQKGPAMNSGRDPECDKGNQRFNVYDLTDNKRPVAQSLGDGMMFGQQNALMDEKGLPLVSMAKSTKFLNDNLCVYSNIGGGNSYVFEVEVEGITSQVWSKNMKNINGRDLNYSMQTDKLALDGVKAKIYTGQNYENKKTPLGGKHIGSIKNPTTIRGIPKVPYTEGDIFVELEPGVDWAAMCTYLICYSCIQPVGSIGNRGQTW